MFRSALIWIIILNFLSLALQSESSRRAGIWDFDHGIDLPTRRPLNVAHRGSSGALPEHTVEAYRLAIDEGADVIECDLTLTKDLVLICMHESWMNATTNVAKVFPENRTNTYFVADQARFYNDYFSVDFTLDEIKQIRKIQRFGFRNPNFNNLYEIPTLEEYVNVAKNASRPVGIYVEIKDPIFMNSLPIVQEAQTTFEDLILDALHGFGYTAKSSPCFVQCFEENSLVYVSNRTQLPLIKLIGYPSPVGDTVLARIATYAYGIGPDKRQLIRLDSSNVVVERTDLVDRSHGFGLRVHPYTLRNEYQYLAWDYEQDPWKEHEDVFQLGVDGLFTDFPGTYDRFLHSMYNCSSQSRFTPELLNIDASGHSLPLKSNIYAIVSLILVYFVWG